MAISKILDSSAGSESAVKLPQNIRYDRESQNCDWVLFSVTRFLISQTSYPNFGSAWSDIILVLILGPCSLWSDFCRTLNQPKDEYLFMILFRNRNVAYRSLQVFATDPWDHFHKLAPYNISHHNIKGTLLRNRRTILNTITLTLTDYPNRSSSPSNKYKSV